MLVCRRVYTFKFSIVLNSVHAPCAVLTVDKGPSSGSRNSAKIVSMKTHNFKLDIHKIDGYSKKTNISKNVVC